MVASGGYFGFSVFLIFRFGPLPARQIEPPLVWTTWGALQARAAQWHQSRAPDGTVKPAAKPGVSARTRSGKQAVVPPEGTVFAVS